MDGLLACHVEVECVTYPNLVKERKSSGANGN